MLGLSFAAVPLYDLFCRVTGFGGTTQISKNIPKIVLDKKISVRFDTNVNKLPWNFKIKENVIDVKIGQVSRAQFEVENYGDETTYGVASFNVSPSSFGKYFSKLGCFCFEKQKLNPGEKTENIMTFYLDPEIVNDSNTKNIEDVTLSYTFFPSEYYEPVKN
jgi:cytochrome c oxidase assembly protein subunit 11